MGLLSGHIYYFFRELLPREGGPNLLEKTPQVFDKIMMKLREFRVSHGIRGNYSRFGYRNTGSPRTTSNSSSSRRVFIGRGVRLGDN
ncbi:DER1-like protein, putative [Plasmodium ovale wallikeri]|nr:DER1-like protein, putative [Plasmodium ovale wallikeri]SBT33416.1 DER1-like protein, putative [Plasmodium ovale wallikeri]